MGAKDWFICYADDDVPSVLAARTAYDPAATDALVRRLFPSQTVTPDGAGTLGGDANPDDDMLYAAVWPGATIVCTSRAALNRPSELEARFLAEGRAARSTCTPCTVLPTGSHSASGAPTGSCGGR